MTDWPDWMYGNIPEHMREGIHLYVTKGIEPGGFLYAVLCNDLYEALSRADPINKGCLPTYAEMLRYIPPECWGNPLRVQAWVKHGGWEGLQKKIEETDHG